MARILAHKPKVKKVRKRHGALCSVYLTFDTIDKCREISDAENITFSKALQDLCEVAIEAIHEHSYSRRRRKVKKNA